VACLLGVVVGGSFLGRHGRAPVSSGLEKARDAFAFANGDLPGQQRDALSLAKQAGDALSLAKQAGIEESGPAQGVLSDLSGGAPTPTAGATGEAPGQQQRALSLAKQASIEESGPTQGVLSGLSGGAPGPTLGATGEEGVNELSGAPQDQPGAPRSGAETAGLPVGFVRLREVDATILQDIRYASANNFTGARVPGYDTGECILRREVAEALKLIQTDLRPHGLSLKVYDCYRPLRAVKAFMQWVQKKPDALGDGRYWLGINRGKLVKLGYIGAHSTHSTGMAVDLTLVAFPFAQPARLDQVVSPGPCNARSADRRPDTSLDMGTSFDCFDAMSNTASPEITEEQRENRRMLVEVMSAGNFKNYVREWWHFTYTAPESPPVAQDFVITNRDLRSAGRSIRGPSDITRPVAHRIGVATTK
jgi:D-alanyl-D-alanine dipeptidase